MLAKQESVLSTLLVLFASFHFFFFMCMYLSFSSLASWEAIGEVYCTILVQVGLGKVICIGMHQRWF